MIEGHGDDLHLYDRKIIHNFSSNVYYKGCPTALLDQLASGVNAIESYPSPSASELNHAASNKFDLPPDHFLFTNGATEAFYLIAQVFAGKTVAIASPTFSEYEDACEVHGLVYQLVDRKELTASDYDLVFICNPNNPDGSVISKEDLIEQVEGSPSTVFVIDEAYIEFTSKTESVIPLINRMNNLVVVRSLTKTFSVPGIRLGYVVAASTIIKRLLHKKMPWSVNALAIQAGQQLFKHYDQWLFNVEKLLEETSEFTKELSSIKWLKVKPGCTSYFLAELIEGKASTLKEHLVNQHGILIRDATNFNGLDGEHIRLAVQGPEANLALIKALKSWK